MNNSNVNEMSNMSDEDPTKFLKSLKIRNINRLVIAQLNINSIRNKFDALRILIQGNLDVIIITETKLDESFPTEQFYIEGFNLPFRRNRNGDGGGILI